MSGGPIFPSSIYLGAGSGNLSPTFYTPTTNTNSAGYIEGIGVVGSLNADASATLQFNLPESIPTGVFKCRVLAWANAATGEAQLTLNDGQTAPASNIGQTTLSAETQLTVAAWPGADQIVEVAKQALTTVPTANDILTIRVDFNHTNWTLTANSVWQFSLVWE